MADNGPMGRNRDLVLAPGEFAFVLDTTKGNVNVHAGPSKTSMSDTDQPVVFDDQTLRFRRVDATDAVQINAIAPEGFYLALYNPAADDKQAHPMPGRAEVAAPLTVGHRVNVPGPVNFPLWPGQMVDVIRGHHLRSNQYLLAQVYNDAEASANWPQAVLKGVGPDVAVATPQTFAPGQLMVIKGTEVAFFIPPTGVKVVPEGEAFVREAVTLERLDYCILKDEDGNKRFVQGPAVVFPEPTEQFVVKDQARIYKAIELNATTGLYIKVIADYEDESGTHKAGDELFITGAEQAIYFQREEHSVIRYGTQTKHYAVAIPAGEGRYVLDRLQGDVSLVTGPRMLLCDPRSQVIVRRVLAAQQVALWYPGNSEAARINADLMAEMTATGASAYEAGRAASVQYMAMNADSAQVMRSRQVAGDTFNRSDKFTPPRTITLDTKYEGAVAVTVWAGYAVLAVDRTGGRRVIQGPQTALLQYDETLTPMELSTGTPKTDTALLKTVYLRTGNNKVSDAFLVETQDFVQLTVALSYRTNFEGPNPEAWFGVENYVRLLCDHLRSLIRNAVKRQGVTAFYGNAIDVIRDAALGTPVAGVRPGRVFAENGMRVYDVEVLDVKVSNPDVARLLTATQTDTLTEALTLAKQQRTLAFTTAAEAIKRQMAEEVATTALNAHTLAITEAEAKQAADVALATAEAALVAARLTAQVAEQTDRKALHDADLARSQALEDQLAANRAREIGLQITQGEAQTKEVVARAAAVSQHLTTALTTFADQALVKEMTTALAPMAMMSGVSAADIMGQLLKGTPFGDAMKALGSRTRMPELTPSR